MQTYIEHHSCRRCIDYAILPDLRRLKDKGTQFQCLFVDQ